MRLYTFSAALLSVLSFSLIGTCAHSLVETKAMIGSYIKALPGSLDQTPVFNSNCPEVILAEGILLSTHSKTGKKFPGAHLDYAFKDNFEIFLHHIANGEKSGHMEDLYLGLLAENEGEKPVTLHFVEGASYLSQPDAPFVSLKTVEDNTAGNIYAGPSDRVCTELLTHRSPGLFQKQFLVKPHSTVLLAALPIPVAGLVPPLNGRNTLIKAKSDGPIRLSSVALFAIKNDKGNFEKPKLEDFTKALLEGDLVRPRGLTPSHPGEKGPYRYGRVAGVGMGARWQCKNIPVIDIDSSKQNISFPVATVEGGAFGTGQVQSAPLVRRYEDTAYAAHGNYGVLYDLDLPVKNKSGKDLNVALRFDCPLKLDNQATELTFLSPPSTMVFFRGSVQSTVKLDDGKILSQTKHLVLHKGEKGPVLVSFKLPVDKSAVVSLKFIYPGDCTPPEAITVEFKEWELESGPKD